MARRRHDLHVLRPKLTRLMHIFSFVGKQIIPILVTVALCTYQDTHHANKKAIIWQKQNYTRNNICAFYFYLPSQEQDGFCLINKQQKINYVRFSLFFGLETLTQDFLIESLVLSVCVSISSSPSQPLSSSYLETEGSASCPGILTSPFCPPSGHSAVSQPYPVASWQEIFNHPSQPVNFVLVSLITSQSHPRRPGAGLVLLWCCPELPDGNTGLLLL